MSERVFRILSALCGVVGAVILVASFRMNPGPPTGSSVSQLLEFARIHQSAVFIGAWLQAMGSLLNVVFVLAVVRMCGAGGRVSGWITFLAAGTVLLVSLIEVTFYIAAVQAATGGDQGSAVAAFNLINAVQHVFLIAPVLLLPFGVVILGLRVFPRLFAFSALTIGASLQVLGLAGLFVSLQPLVDIILIVQELWLLALAIVVALPRRKGLKLRPRHGLAALAVLAVFPALLSGCKTFDDPVRIYMGSDTLMGGTACGAPLRIAVLGSDATLRAIDGHDLNRPVCSANDSCPSERVSVSTWWFRSLPAGRSS